MPHTRRVLSPLSTVSGTDAYTEGAVLQGAHPSAGHRHLPLGHRSGAVRFPSIRLTFAHS